MVSHAAYAKLSLADSGQSKPLLTPRFIWIPSNPIEYFIRWPEILAPQRGCPKNWEDHPHWKGKQALRKGKQAEAKPSPAGCDAYFAALFHKKPQFPRDLEIFPLNIAGHFCQVVNTYFLYEK